MDGLRHLGGYAWAIAATAGCTVAGMLMAPHFNLVNIAMIYLLAVVAVALRSSRGAAVLTSLLCVAAFDYFFVPPQGTFTVDDVQYLVTFAIMLGVGLVISGLAGNVRQQASEQAGLAVAAETERIRSALLGSISHDLRTPLAVMSGASSSLAERGEQMSAQERQALARSVFDQSRGMAEHVSKILQMTRLEHGALEIRGEWSSMDEIVGSTLSRLRERLAGHRLVVEIAPGLPLVRVDAALVEQALANLLENAAKHTPAGTVVRLRVECTPAEMTVSVEDHGGGLAPADTERVFAKFQHGAGEGGALGLGLAICRAIVRLHHGRAWAERIVGGGIAFRFTLPVEAHQPTMPAESA